MGAAMKFSVRASINFEALRREAVRLIASLNDNVNPDGAKNRRQCGACLMGGLALVSVAANAGVGVAQSSDKWAPQGGLSGLANDPGALSRQVCAVERQARADFAAHGFFSPGVLQGMSGAGPAVGAKAVKEYARDHCNDIIDVRMKVTAIGDWSGYRRPFNCVAPPSSGTGGYSHKLILEAARESCPQVAALRVTEVFKFDPKDPSLARFNALNDPHFIARMAHLEGEPVGQYLVAGYADRLVRFYVDPRENATKALRTTQAAAYPSLSVGECLASSGLPNCTPIAEIREPNAESMLRLDFYGVGRGAFGRPRYSVGVARERCEGLSATLHERDAQALLCESDSNIEWRLLLHFVEFVYPLMRESQKANVRTALRAGETLLLDLRTRAQKAAQNTLVHNIVNYTLKDTDIKICDDEFFTTDIGKLILELSSFDGYDYDSQQRLQSFCSLAYACAFLNLNSSIGILNSFTSKMVSSGCFRGRLFNDRYLVQEHGPFEGAPMLLKALLEFGGSDTEKSLIAEDLYGAWLRENFKASQDIKKDESLVALSGVALGQRRVEIAGKTAFAGATTVDGLAIAVRLFLELQNIDVDKFIDVLNVARPPIFPDNPLQ